MIKVVRKGQLSKPVPQGRRSGHSVAPPPDQSFIFYYFRAKFYLPAKARAARLVSVRAIGARPMVLGVVLALHAASVVSLIKPSDSGEIGFELQVENVKAQQFGALATHDWSSSRKDFGTDGSVLFNDGNYSLHVEICTQVPFSIFCFVPELVTQAVRLREIDAVLDAVASWGRRATHSRAQDKVYLEGVQNLPLMPRTTHVTPAQSRNQSGALASATERTPFGLCVCVHATIALALRDVMSWFAAVLTRLDPRAHLDACKGVQDPKAALVCKRAKYWDQSCSKRRCMDGYLTPIARACRGAGADYCGFLVLVIHFVHVTSAPRLELMKARYAKYKFDASAPPLALPVLVRTHFGRLWAAVSLSERGHQGHAHTVGHARLLSDMTSLLGDGGLDTVLYAEGFNSYPGSSWSTLAREMLPSGIEDRNKAAEWLVAHQDEFQTRASFLDPGQPHVWLPSRNVTVRSWVDAFVLTGRDLFSDHDGLFSGRGDVDSHGAGRAVKAFSAMGTWELSESRKVHLEVRGDLFRGIPTATAPGHRHDSHACTDAGSVVNRGSLPYSAAVEKMRAFVELTKGAVS